MAHADAVVAEGPFGFRAWCRRGVNRMAAAHSHGDVEINFSPAGEFRYLLGGEQVSIPPGRLGLFWGAVPHRFLDLVGDAQAMCYWVTVPLHLLLGWSLPDAFARDLLAGRMVVDRQAAPADELQLTAWASDLARDAPAARRRTAALEVEARLRRLALDHGWSSSARARRTGPDARRTDGDDPAHRMARFIADRYADPITVADIADHVRLNPNYAMTLFRARMGTTLTDHLTRQRVAHAQRLLLTTDRTILDIGFTAGFGSVSRYYAAFKRITRRSPRAYRQAVRGGG